MKELHLNIFKHMRFVFSEWAGQTHPETKRAPNKDQRGLKQLPAFPYRRHEGDA